MPPEFFAKKSSTPNAPGEAGPVSTVERLLGAQVRTNAAADKPSIISEGFRFTGDVISTGTLHVEGEITGTIKVDEVRIGPSGVIAGSIECTTLHVRGTLRGTAECVDLQIDSTAVVDGTLSYRVFAIERGARIVGDLLRRS